MAEAGCAHALFIGDDLNDEAVFRLDRRRVLSIRVEPSPESAAAYFLEGQPEVDAVLRALLRFCTPPRSAE